MIGENVKKAIVSFRDWLLGVLNHWRAAIVLFVVVVALTVLISNYAPDGVKFFTANNTSIALTAVTLFALFGLVLAITFFWVFRGIKADEDKVNAIITYCHAFIMFSLSASILPFITLPLLPGLYNLMVTSPIGIVAGCSLPADKDLKSVPIELRCGVDSDQWVVNIGGTTSRAMTPGDNAAGPTKAENAAEAGPTKPYNVVIRGGLVVPLYAVVLSLMGAAVSMTRRVPEYQRRLSLVLGDAEYLTWDRAREALVFQIMQVLSAPLIAVTAYYLVNPGSRSSTIVLSFISGFSSETVLLLIRAIMEKVQPEAVAGSAKPPDVTFAPARLDFGNVPAQQVAKKSVVMTNRGLAPLIVSSLTCTGEFSAVTQAPLNIAPGSNGTIEIEFKPINVGPKQGELTVIDDAPGSPRTLDLTGTGS